MLWAAAAFLFPWHTQAHFIPDTAGIIAEKISAEDSRRAYSLGFA